jgi:hypothetical protein
MGTRQSDDPGWGGRHYRLLSLELASEHTNGENLLVIQDPRLAGVYTENWRRHAAHSIACRGTVPWWAHIRRVWVYFTRKRSKQLDREIG